MKNKTRKMSCGCKSNVNKSCGCNSCNTSNVVNPSSNMSNCNEYKQLANEKCQQAECINNKANRIAQQALAAEQKAECLKQQAIEECKRANELWAQYDQLADQGICLMQQAQACLAKSVECYEDLYEDVEGCNLADYGYNSSHVSNNSCGCNKNCGCGC
ncbi:MULTISPECIES: hypothetical protein [unclassified Romboutsia]|uniref:hypothetical protein n=1 Tax=unclassified Romboutsia TaxID=2626894 RepID=UPI0008224EB5|nr:MULTISPECIES: hypothetical protein [unclassified Romboutsia]SCI26395.1 Uncharacterised protein [uncultured Clostridium sp.]